MWSQFAFRTTLNYGHDVTLFTVELEAREFADNVHLIFPYM